MRLFANTCLALVGWGALSYLGVDAAHGFGLACMCLGALMVRDIFPPKQP